MSRRCSYCGSPTNNPEVTECSDCGEPFVVAAPHPPTGAELEDLFRGEE